MLDVGGRPVALSRDVVSLVEQGIEGLKYECLVPLLFRLTHRFDPPSTVVASLCGEAAVNQQTVAGHERRLAGRKPDGRVGDLFRLANASDGVQGGYLRAELSLLAGKALEHVRVDDRRQNGVDADALFAELQGGRLREADDGVFAGDVDFVPGKAITPNAEEVFTMAPPPVLSMAGISYLMLSHTPFTLMSMTRS